ncbi:hypothetical protein GCM10011514_43260 [Emticicia aquatilis]|uniref:Lantibiotic dehydratase n=2 Tax=Emticicia aquatilis TaxID=1537369 RepID=A0A917DW86_9BACT|nr:hypothetical protein GCM10011514_43260 [Emticicia aquatilis]
MPVDGLFALNQTCQSAIQAEGFLKNLFSTSQMQQTLYVASPALFARFKCWIDGEEIAEKHKLIQTLFKYYLRICSRCTPYGMFAGCSTGFFDIQTQIEFETQNPFRIQSRIDTNYLVEIVNVLLTNESIRNQVRFYPNNTIYQIADKYHYLYYSIQENKRVHEICSIDFSEYVSQILSKAKDGCLIQDLVSVIVSEDISYEEAQTFILQLIEEQLLFSEIEPTITGEDFFKFLLKKISLLTIPEEISTTLHKINELLQIQKPQVTDFEQIRYLITTLTGTPHQDFIQTDLFFNATTNKVNKKIIDDLSRKVEKLMVMNQGNYSASLDNFRKQFYERYEEAEVPLSIALDNEVGIGYADFASNRGGIAVLVEDITPINQSIQEVLWIYWKKFTLKKYSEALQNQAYEVNITEKDLALLAEKNTEFITSPHPTFFVFGSLLADTNSNDNYAIHLKNMSGAAATTMLGRFGHGDSQLTDKLRECTNYEEDQSPDVIFAEIIHLPEARVGNIATRPMLRKFEIPYQTPARVLPENQILIEDLMVSVKRGKQIILRSKKHNKRVIPRLSSAHNYQNGLSIYRFLCDLQTADECINVNWHWNVLINQPFLPRVRYQNIILSVATWNINTEEEQSFSQKEVSLPKLKELQKKYKIPRYVMLSEADNELWIDFENEMCLQLLKDYYTKNTLVTLKEVLFSPENCFIKTYNGNYNNEIIIPFKVTDYKPQNIVLNRSHNDLQRSFSVGSEWFYVKIYCGEKTGEELLKTSIKQLVEELIEDEAITSFFFIRYQDPEPHLRLRFRGNPKDLFYAPIVARLSESLSIHQESGLVHKIMIDTYKREIERYGAETMVLSEEFFAIDSLSVLEFIAENPDDHQRLSFALRRINTYLKAFGFDIEAKKAFTEKMQKSFLEEFGDESNLRKKLNDKYRNLSKQIIETISTKDNFNIDQLVSQITELSADKNQLYSLLSSYIHMFINRLFISSNRTYELTLYHFLTKTYMTLSKFGLPLTK